MKQRVNALSQVLHVSESGSVPIPRVPLIEIIGHNRVLIENHCGVTAYAPNEIAVRISSGTVIILGKELMLAHMMKDRIIITGCIDTVHLNGKV